MLYSLPWFLRKIQYSIKRPPVLSLLFHHPHDHKDTVKHGQPPGNGICKADAKKAQSAHRQNTAQASADEFSYAGDHRLDAVAQPLKGISKDHEKAVEGKEQAHNTQIGKRPCGYCRIGVP